MKTGLGWVNGLPRSRPVLGKGPGPDLYLDRFRIWGACPNPKH